MLYFCIKWRNMEFSPFLWVLSVDTVCLSSSSLVQTLSLISAYFPGKWLTLDCCRYRVWHKIFTYFRFVVNWLSLNEIFWMCDANCNVQCGCGPRIFSWKMLFYTAKITTTLGGAAWQDTAVKHGPRSGASIVYERDRDLFRNFAAGLLI